MDDRHTNNLRVMADPIDSILVQMQGKTIILGWDVAGGIDIGVAIANSPH